MPVAVRCPECGNSGTVPDRPTWINCSKCGGKFPVSPAMPPAPHRRPPVMYDLYDLEREFFAAKREMRDALDRARTAHDELKAYPVHDQDIEQFRRARQQTEDLLQKYEVEREKLGKVDATIARLEEMARTKRRKLDRGRFLYSPVGQGLICTSEIVVVIALGMFCLLRLPAAIWAILACVIALGAVAITLVIFASKRQSHVLRLRYLTTELASIEREVLSCQPSRAAAAAEVDRAHESWAIADKALQDSKDRIRPWIRHERTTEDFEQVRQYFEEIRAQYEHAQTERRLSLLRRDWRYLKADRFESFVREIFEALGYQTAPIGKAGDQGVDLIATCDGIRWAIQCKGYSGTLGNKPIQEVFTGACIHNCQRFLVITTSEFTSGGREAATRTGCVLVAGSDIPELIKGNLRLK